MRPAVAVTHNGRAIALAAVPRVSLAELAQLAEDAATDRRRVSALFAMRSPSGALELILVLADDTAGALELARVELASGHFPSMSEGCPQVHLFERALAEDWGLVPDGHPWLKPVRRPLDATKFHRVEGDEVHEVAVGPVHAGVIEPGHFRFQCHGEHVFHLEIALGYQHRGVKQAVLREPAKRVVHYMETLAGDTTIGHTTAYCAVIEALSGVQPGARAHAIRAIALELERLANHTGDLGALAGDVGFLPTASYCGRLRGDFLNLSALLSGSRFGRGLVRPGGVRFDLDPERAAAMAQRLDAALADVENAVDLLWETPSVVGRFEETGRVDEPTARALGLVGFAARASGIERDVRVDHPAGLFRFVQLPVSTWPSGDVFARAYVRWLELQRSITFIRGLLDTLPGGALRTAPAPLAPDHIAVALVEGWRGEICHVAVTGADGALAAYEIVDPSFHNWTGLAMALRDQQISDFPLCNKSFNLSYCGHDL